MQYLGILAMDNGGRMDDMEICYAGFIDEVQPEDPKILLQSLMEGHLQTAIEDIMWEEPEEIESEIEGLKELFGVASDYAFTTDTGIYFLIPAGHAFYEKYARLNAPFITDEDVLNALVSDKVEDFLMDNFAFKKTHWPEPVGC